MTTISIIETAVCTIVDRRLRELGVTMEGRPYTQRDAERPRGCGRAKYLRVWRLAHRAGDAGARAQGKSRLLTPEAFERFEAQLRKPRRAVLHVVPEPSTDDRVLAALGGRRSA